MGTTPGTNRAIHNLHGTIYNRVVDSGDPNIIYHCHAAISKEAIETNPVWTVWREDLTTGDLKPPKSADKSRPQPDNNICSSLETTSFWNVPEPGLPLTVDNNIIHADQTIFTADQTEF